MIASNAVRRVCALVLCAALALPVGSPYVVAVEAQDSYDPDNTWEQARDVTPYLIVEVGGADTHWFGSAPRDEWRRIEWASDATTSTPASSDEDWVRFDVSQPSIDRGESFLFEAVAVDALVDPVLEIYGPFGTAEGPDPTAPGDLGQSSETTGVTETDPNALFANDDGVWFADRSSSLSFIPPKKGRYFVRVRPYYQFEGGSAAPGFRGGTGRYRLKFKVGQTTRVAGANRVSTAVQVSRERFPSFGPTGPIKAAVLAHAYSFPDALSGSTLAGAVGGPILLTPSGSLPAEVRAEIDRLDVDRVYILGGQTAVSSAVAAQVAAISVTATRNVEVERIPGVNRVDTARLVALEAAALGPTAPVAFVTNSKRFPDALAAAPMAVHNVAPVLLTPGDRLDSRTRAALQDPALGITGVVIVGGEDVVSSAVAVEIATILGSSSRVKRIAGRTRYQTARHFAVWATGWEAGANPALHVDRVGTSADPTALDVLDFDRIGLVNGENFPDALAGGALCGLARAPILLTKATSMSPYTLDYLDVSPPGSRRDYWGAAPRDFERCYVIGGASVVDPSVFRTWDIWTGPNPL